MTLVAILQRFDLVMDDPTYTLQLKQTLTIKPKDFYIHAIPRNDKPKMTASPSTITSQEMGTPSGITSTPAQSINEPRQPLYVLYGSNTGSSEAFAQRIASDAPSYGRCRTTILFYTVLILSSGFQARIGTLDSAKDRIMTNGPTIIVTASFEGT